MIGVVGTIGQTKLLQFFYIENTYYKYIRYHINKNYSRSNISFFRKFI